LDMYINYEIIVTEITSPGIVYQAEDFHIRCFYLRHTKPCLGYTLEEYKRPGEFHPEKAAELGVPMGPLWSRLQHGETVKAANGACIQPEDVMGPSRSGRKFSFVTDSLYFPDIAQEVQGSDFFVCEGMFTRDLAESAREKRHMTSEQAAKIALDAGVKKLALIHYSPRYNEYNLKELLKEAQAVFPETILSRDRSVHPIEYID
ncbi:MAG: ribonuclease Z, partial [Spirochaetaceae bacterium]|nr:ribonuclease Z [Spirochaetaceae bacterium]